MLTYFDESDDIKMDVQVGPGEEIESEVEGEDFCDRCGNPVDSAKKDPNTVPVGCCTNREGVKEFYIDAADIAKLAKLNEMNLMEALDEIIDCNEGSGMCPDNIIVVMSEGTEEYARVLERNGANYAFVNEATDESQESDIRMDVQVGPGSDEITVSEDPQEANPVDAVKRQYDSVVVAKDGDNFFMDVEDVQKCAELNCESVIDTLNNIINVNEEFDMNPNNIVVIVTENTHDYVYNELCESGVLMEAKFNFLPKFKREPKLQEYIDDLDQAQKYLNMSSIDSKTTCMRLLRTAARIIDIVYNVGAVIGFPMVVSIVGIPVYLVNRVISWGLRYGEEKFAEEQGYKVLRAYKSAIDKCEDDKVKEELQKQHAKLKASIEKFTTEE